jgi:Lrp/AsnC family transcriptional regulator
MSSIDSTDRKLLRHLQRDATLTHADLATRVGTSAASCWRRVKAMEEQGVLREAVRLVDPKKVGRGVNVMCQARLKSHSPEHRKAFEQFMQAHEEVMECYSMSGEWDYLMRIVVGDVGEYERFLMKDLLGHPSVATAASSFALSQLKYTTVIPT